MPENPDESRPEALLRPGVPQLDAILGQPFEVLDQGFVRVIDYMGSDASIVQAARVSYGAGTRRVHEDRGLIRYLMRHAHTTPFEMCELKLHVRAPMDCWRQWIRHRTANVNEYSTRYSVAIDAFQRTPSSGWRTQATANRQGSGDFVAKELGEVLSAEESALHEQSRKIYESRLSQGVAREQARKDLPLSTYTEAYWKVDLHNLLHFLALRMDPHAQAEIREYASIIGREIVSKWCPFTWEAFVDYRLESQRFTRIDLDIMEKLIAGDAESALRTAENAGWLNRDDAGALRAHRERAEFEAKIARFDVEVPWRA